MQNCNNGTIAPYVPTNEKPWNLQRIHHLYKRAGFGISPNFAIGKLDANPQQLVEQMVTEAQNLGLTPTPYWINYTRDQTNSQNLVGRELREFTRKTAFIDFSNNLLRDRMTYFWMNHLVTQESGFEGGGAQYMFQYYNLLQKYALGNFKELIYDIGISSPMLVYLNGHENNKEAPNENYARELFELFTLGENNGYTQDDIIETARALTGYTQWEGRGHPVTFDPNNHDTGSKTIFGKTGNWDYDGLINLLFNERPNEIAEYICEKLYKYFISPEPDGQIVNQLAITFKNNNFEIAPVLKQLLASEHFFDEKSFGTIVKSPLDMFILFINDTAFETDDDLATRINENFSKNLGQYLFEPPDVAGWKGDKTWINSSSITQRWTTMGNVLNRFWNFDSEQFRTWAISLAGDKIDDPEEVARRILDFLLPNRLPEVDEYEEAIMIFKSRVPQNYFDDNSWNLFWVQAPEQVKDLLQHIFRIPEFQLR